MIFNPSKLNLHDNSRISSPFTLTTDALTLHVFSARLSNYQKRETIIKFKRNLNGKVNLLQILSNLLQIGQRQIRLIRGLGPFNNKFFDSL
jgi:hypothetical protein